MMECPKCCGDTTVLDTRFKYDVPYRRRLCKNCGYLFQTVEITENYYKFLKLDNKED
jgi:transcriptional regulator NrdR family protein